MKLLAQRLILGILSLISVVAYGSSTRRALVVGNDTYPGNKLQNARNDATAVSAGLSSLGYVSTLVLDVDRRSLNVAVDRFSASLSPGDIALVYYAGHGLQVEGENYLVPVDFRASDETDVKYQAFALSVLLTKLTEHGASTQVIVLDACRDNPFLGSRSVRSGWASVGTSAGTFLAFGTSPGSTASDDPNEKHGLFTDSLLRFLSSSLDIEQMFQKIRQEVIRKSNGHQVPWTASSLIGSLHLDPSGDSAEPSLQDFAITRSEFVGFPQARSVLKTTALGRAAVIPSSLSSIEEARLLNVALSHMRSFHFSLAIPILQSIVAFDPRCGLALRLLGAALHLMGRGVEARRSLDLAIGSDPTNALSYSYRCLMTAAEDLTPFQDDCQKAISIRNDLPQAHMGLALQLAANGNAGAAYSEVSRAISLDPMSAASLSLRGDIAVTQDRLYSARPDYESAKRIALAQAR